MSFRLTFHSRWSSNTQIFTVFSDVTLVPTRHYTVDPACDCGCSTTSPAAYIVSSSTCRSGTVLQWYIDVGDEHVVHLQFDRFTLDGENPYSWIKVRDGHSSWSTLLVNSGGGVTPAPVTTSQSRMLIEFMTPNRDRKSNGGYERPDPEGFSATYTALGIYRPARKLLID